MLVWIAARICVVKDGVRWNKNHRTCNYKITQRETYSRGEGGRGKYESRYTISEPNMRSKRSGKRERIFFSCVSSPQRRGNAKALPAAAEVSSSGDREAAS